MAAVPHQMAHGIGRVYRKVDVKEHKNEARNIQLEIEVSYSFTDGVRTSQVKQTINYKFKKPR